MELTYVMLKPDAVPRKLAGKIIARMEEKGFEIVSLKVMTLDEEILREYYAHVADKPFSPDLVAYMTSGPVWCLAVEGKNAILGMRILTGATIFEYAQAGIIRGIMQSPRSVTSSTLRIPPKAQKKS